MKETLTEFELRVVDLFVNACRTVGLPKSVGEIYGVIYASATPLSMDEIMGKLGLSLGSTSQGLKMLRSFGAVKTVYQPGSRKDYFTVELDFRKVITQYLADVVVPQFSSTKTQLEGLSKEIQSGQMLAEVEVTERIRVLEKVSQRANLLLPAVSKILSL